MVKSNLENPCIWKSHACMHPINLDAERSEDQNLFISITLAFFTSTLLTNKFHLSTFNGEDHHSFIFVGTKFSLLKYTLFFTLSFSKGCLCFKKAFISLNFVHKHAIVRQQHAYCQPWHCHFFGVNCRFTLSKVHALSLSFTPFILIVIYLLLRSIFHPPRVVLLHVRSYVYRDSSYIYLIRGLSNLERPNKNSKIQWIIVVI